MTTHKMDIGEIVSENIKTNEEFKSELAEAINGIVGIAHGLAKHSGWWDIPQSVIDAKEALEGFYRGDYSLPMGAVRALKAQAEWQPNIAEKICLIHSEASEMMEGDRKNLMDDHLKHRKMVEVEAADLVIRAFDLAGYMNFDLGATVVEKLAYNQSRADHKRENRAKDDGKKY